MQLITTIKILGILTVIKILSKIKNDRGRDDASRNWYEMSVKAFYNGNKKYVWFLSSESLPF